MAIARVTTWSSGQTLTATALNAEFDNLLSPINAILPGSYGTGDLLYASSASQWAALGAGTQNFVLQMGASIPAWFNLFGTANTWTANQTISNTAPSLVLTDTTGSAKSLTVAVDANLAQLRESAGASGSLLVLDLANNRLNLATASPSGAALLNLNPVPSANWTISGANPSSLVTIANDGTYDLAVGSGLVILHPHNADYRPIIFSAGGGVTSIIDDAGSFGSVAQGTASKINFYYNAGTATYRIENKRGASRDIYITTIMTRDAS